MRAELLHQQECWDPVVAELEGDQSAGMNPAPQSRDQRSGMSVKQKRPGVAPGLLHESSAP
jgi:hypothetical protein